MKRHLRLAAVMVPALAVYLHPTSPAATYTYSGVQSAMNQAQAPVVTYDTVDFNVTGGYFGTSGARSQTYENPNIIITDLSMNNGWGEAVTTFAEATTVTGSGAITLTTAGLGQDFVFAGDMTGYTGDISIADFGGASTTLGQAGSSIVQFGGNTAGGTVAQGTVTGSSPDRVIDNVTGTGAITANNAVINYGTDDTYDFLRVGNSSIAVRDSLAFTGNANIESASIISGGGLLLKEGTGNLTLSGANTYTGGTIIDGGVLTMANARATGSNGTTRRDMTIRSGELELAFDSNTGAYGSGVTNWTVLFEDLTLGGTAGQTSTLSSSGLISGNPVGFGVGPGTGGVITYDATNDGETATIDAYWSATGTSGTAAARVIVGDSIATDIELDIAGRISNTGQSDGRSVTLKKEGAGTLRISAANFLPRVEVAAGTLIVNDSNALGASRTGQGGLTNLVTVSGGTLDLNGFNNSIGGLADGGVATGSILNNGASGSTLAVGSSNDSTAYSGSISDGSSAIALSKTGSGTLSLSGANSYTGGTTLSNGTLATGHFSALGSGGLTVSGGTLDLGDDLTVASLSGTGGAVDMGTHQLTLNASGNIGTFYGGTLSGTGGITLRGGSDSVSSADGSVGGTGNFFLLTQGPDSGSSFALDTGSSTSDRRDFGWAESDGSTLNLSSLSGYGAIRGDAGDPGDGMREIVVNQSTNTVFNGALLSHYSGGGAERSLTLTKQGSGSLTLAGFIGEQTASASSGPDVVNLTVEAGTLNVTNSSNGTAANGTSGTSTVTGGTLSFSANALGQGGAGTIRMDGGTLRWNSGNTQDVSSQLLLIDSKIATFNTNGNDVVLAGTLGGGTINASVVKTGAGSLTVGGLNQYSGSTTVSQGSLIIDGSLSTGDLSVASGASLLGSGTIGGATTIQSGATLSPGSSPGLLTINNTLSLEGTTLMEIAGLSLGTQHDSISVTGLLTYGGDLSIISIDSYDLAQAASYTLFGMSGGSTGGFDTVTVDGLALVENAGTWSAEDGGLTYTFNEFSGQLVVIPEPAISLLGSLGLLALLRRRRR